MMSTPVKIIQLSDLHQFADPAQTLMGMNPDQSLRAVLTQLQSIIPMADMLLLTGDLAQDKQPATYSRIAQLIDTYSIPTYWLAGNHDQPATVIAHYLTGNHLFEDKVITADHWRCILLNSQLPNAVPGYINETELAFLDTQLQQSTDQHCLVALHHQPVNIGSKWLDQLGLQNQSDFWRIIDKHPQVRAVIWGHVHQDYDGKRNHVQLFAAPSTWIQFSKNSDTFAVDPQHKPGCRWYDLYPDGRIVTGIIRATDFNYTPPDNATQGY